MKRGFSFAAIFLFVIIAAACSDTGSTEPEKNDSKDEPARLSAIQEQVFDKSCAFTGCHAGTTPTGGMDLSNGKSYSSLVDVESNLNPNFKRVEPGNSSNSYLIKMMRNNGEGTRQMPPSGMLDESLIIYVEKWIDEGAEDN